MANNMPAPAPANLLSGLTVTEGTAAAEGAPQLHFFNTMTKKKQLFVPSIDGEVSMYVCGVRPYDWSHALTSVAFDVLYRYLMFLGYGVTYVRGSWMILLLVHGLLLRNPKAEFALWKAAKEGEPSWESPWGHERPGWHIECSPMSKHYLDHVFDMHDGGKDLVFPHHVNELAQSQAAYPESDVKCWMHVGFANYNGQKMSKSDKNFKTIREVITRYHPLALRFFLVRTNYRFDVNYSDGALETASDRVYYIYQTLYDCDVTVSMYLKEKISVLVPAEKQKLVDDHHKAFLESMSDDLRTLSVLDGFNELLKAINSNLNDLKKLQQKLEQQKKQQQKKQQQKQQKPQKQPEDHIQALAALSAEIKSKLSILGLMPLSSSLAEVPS